MFGESAFNKLPHIRYLLCYATYKLNVARMEIVFPYCDYPIERIIDYRVYVLRHFALAAEHERRSADKVKVARVIIVYKITLISVARPYPAVALDSVKKGFSAVQLKRICADIPYLVYKLVITREFSSRTQRQIFVIVINGKILAVILYIDVSACAAAEAHFISRKGDRIYYFGMFRIERFLARFAVSYENALPSGLYIRENELAHKLPAEVKKHAAVCVFCRNRRQPLI